MSGGCLHSVGLKSDGTVVAVGNNDYGQCNVGDWTHIVAISAGYDQTVGLKKDGTVVAVGNNKYNQCDVGLWKDIGIPN
ncbi:MAG: chromosome condensation regulator [Bacillota bacterium]|nr:chromosome condensation regulator [Bacillota bacterium]